MRGPLVALPIIAVLALGGIGVGVYALTKDPSLSSLRGDVRTLRADLASENREIATLKTSTADAATAGNVSTLQNSVSSVQNTMRMYKVCIPELQQQINGMTVQTSNNGGYLTDAYLQNPTIVSSDCTKFLNGQ